MHLPQVSPLSVWPPLLVVAAPGGVSARHHHHTLHLLLARRGRLRVEVDGAVRHVAGVVTAPDVPHAIDARGREVLMLFVDPESVPGASLEASTDRVRMLDDEERTRLLAHSPASPEPLAMLGWAERALGLLTGDEWRRPRVDPRVRRLLRALRDDGPDADTSLESLATRVKLSPSRLMHVFTESTGVPLRPYLRWLRFQRAASAIVNGAPLSVAAAEAGFSDAAHMSRTFKAMFGLTPSALQRSPHRG